jgi:hypothetical protein
VLATVGDASVKGGHYGTEGDASVKGRYYGTGGDTSVPTPHPLNPRPYAVEQQ